MQFTVLALALVGAAVAAPAPLITPIAHLGERQAVGGGLGGSVLASTLSLFGTLSGDVSSGIPYGCIGGVINGDGVTLCLRDAPAPTPAPVVKRQFQVGGAGEGSVDLPSLTVSGFLSGLVNGASATGCIGGIAGPYGSQGCEGFPLPTGL